MIDVEVREGQYLELDGARIGKCLEACDDFSDSEFPGAQFRYPTIGGAVAVNVAVTGRGIRWDGDARRVRVKVEFVGDGEPSRFSGGWLYV